MSATSVYAGLAERFATVTALKVIILGEPTSIQDSPALFTAFDRFERLAEGHPPSDNLTEMRYFFSHRLVIRWQDNPQAEADMLALLNAIPYAISEEPTLGGRLGRGTARISEGVAGFLTIGGTMYRILDYTSVVLEKAPRSSGL